MIFFIGSDMLRFFGGYKKTQTVFYMQVLHETFYVEFGSNVEFFMYGLIAYDYH